MTLRQCSNEQSWEIEDREHRGTCPLKKNDRLAHILGRGEKKMQRWDVNFSTDISECENGDFVEYDDVEDLILFVE